MFLEVGKVDDIYISRKIRKGCSDAFGFVRYKSVSVAKEAMVKLNGHEVKGLKMTVSVARYDRNGRPSRRRFYNQDQNVTINGRNKEIKFPSFRDTRQYAEVVKGKCMPSNNGGEDSTIPVLFSLKVKEKPDMEQKLRKGVIVETVTPMNVQKVVQSLLKSNLAITGMNPLSPCKLLLFFDSESAMHKSLEDDSVLWSFFDGIREWTEGEFYADRLVWIECFGIHPKCWTLENIKLIGEQWGPVIHIDSETDEFHSLTHARLLVRTKAQNKIDAHIHLLFAHGSCDVWVKEVGCCGYNNAVDGCGHCDKPMVLRKENLQSSEGWTHVSESKNTVPAGSGDAFVDPSPIIETFNFDPLLSEMLIGKVMPHHINKIDPLKMSDAADGIRFPNQPENVQTNINLDVDPDLNEVVQYVIDPLDCVQRDSGFDDIGQQAARVDPIASTDAAVYFRSCDIRPPL